MALKLNILSNYLGSAWVALVSFIFVPGYIKLLGMESYSVICLFTVLQVGLNIVSYTMSPLLNRELALYTSKARDSITSGNLVRSIEIITALISFIFFLLVLISSDYLASNWLNIESLPKDIVSETITLGSILIIMRIFESLYNSALIGLQKQVHLNIILFIGYAIKNIGVFAALHISPTLRCFCIWQISSYFIMLLTEAIIIYKSISASILKSRFSPKELINIKTFASTSFLNGFIYLLSSQLDKFILPKFIPLRYFGYFSVSYSVVMVVNMFITPLTQAFIPRIITLKTQCNESEASNKFHQCAQLISIFSTTAILSLYFFGNHLLYFWNNDIDLTNNLFPIVKLLSIGMLFNALINLPGNLPIIDGNMRVSAQVNFGTMMFTLLIGIFLIKNYQIDGAIMNYIIVSIIPFLLFKQFFKKTFSLETHNWLFNDVLIPFSTLFILFIGSNYLLDLSIFSTKNIIIIVSNAIIICILGLLSCKNINIKDIFNKPVNNNE